MTQSSVLGPRSSSALRPVILPYDGIWPRISVWFHVTIRGDVAPIRVGAGSNVQDGAVLHVDPGAPCLVGEDVTIGHGAIVHGTTVGNGATIGMGATVLSRS